MPDKDHIDLKTIEKYLQGKLEKREAEAVRRHLESCPLCGLEVKRLRRFEAIDADEDLSRKGEWLYARTKLEQAFRERIAPSARGAGGKVVRFHRAARVARWIIPAAAAAAVVVMISRFAMNERHETPIPAGGVMRGTPPVVYGIKLKEPVGEIKASPRVFKWTSERKDDYYMLEIFTPALEKILRVRNIRESSWEAPDSLGIILKPEAIYLWSVRGYRGLQRATVSPNGWFEIKP